MESLQIEIRRRDQHNRWNKLYMPECRIEKQTSADQTGLLLLSGRPEHLEWLIHQLSPLVLPLTQVATIDEALQRINQNRWAAVVVDAACPSLQLASFIQHIHGRPEHALLPVLVQAFESLDATLIEALYASGAADVLPAPPVASTLQAKVRMFDVLHRSRHHAQLVVQESEQLRLLVHGTTEYAIFMLDPSGNVITWNAGAERLKGYSAEEVIGRHFTCFYPPEAINRDWPAFELSAAQTQGRFEDEGWRVRKDGSLFWANVVITALRDKQGNLRGFSKVTRDMTERRRAQEDALRLAEETTARKLAEENAKLIRQERELLQVTLDSIGDGVISTDSHGNVRFLNRIAEQLVGWTTAQAQGHPLPEVFHVVNQATRQAVDNPALRALQAGACVDTNFDVANQTLLISRGGTEYPIDDNAAPILNAEGEIVGSILVFRDVTQRRRSEQTARFLADASAALTVLVDFESTLQKVASLSVPYFADWAAVDILEPDQSLRRVAVAHVDPNKVRLAEEIHRRFPSDQAARGGVWNILRTGQAELVPSISDHMLQVAVQDPELLKILREIGLRSYIGVPIKIRDVTIGVLTFIVSESGHLYDETDLDVAKDLASRAAIAVENSRLYMNLRLADQRKDEFLATLAHELRNPLAPIRNGLQVLRMNNADPLTLSEARQMMERQLNHMVRLVDDLLDVSRITRNKLDLRREDITLDSVIHSAVETSRPLIEQFGHRLCVSMPPQPVFLHADPVRVAQAFSNLLNNSAKYTEAGGAIELTATIDDRTVIVSVKDNGLGIPTEAMPQLFQMFSQIDHNIDRAHGGLGIGLTLVRRLIEMHGGTVQAHSEGAGRGSEFVVRLPISTSRQSIADQTPAVSKLATKKYRILVVDDNQDAALSLAMILKLMGSDVRTAHDGVAANAMAREFQPDVVLLDIGLPKRNGYEACRIMRQEAWSTKTIIIALTGWGQEEDRRRSQEAGFDHHLVKPVSLAELESLFVEKSRV